MLADHRLAETTSLRHQRWGYFLTHTLTTNVSNKIQTDSLLFFLYTHHIVTQCISDYSSCYVLCKLLSYKINQPISPTNLSCTSKLHNTADRLQNKYCILFWYLIHIMWHPRMVSGADFRVIQLYTEDHAARDWFRLGIFLYVVQVATTYSTIPDCVE